MTLAEVLHENNYYTCMAGKWHLGAQKGNIPSERGFEQSFTMLGGGAGHFCHSFALSDSEQPVTFYLDNGKKVDKLPDDFYSTRYYTDKMIEYLRKCPQDKPFFGYLAFTAPHDPLQIIPEWKDREKAHTTADTTASVLPDWSAKSRWDSSLHKLLIPTSAILVYNGTN